MQEIHLKQQQANLLTFIIALCSDDPKERAVAELGAFDLMKELDEYTLNLAIESYGILKSKVEEYKAGDN